MVSFDHYLDYGLIVDIIVALDAELFQVVVSSVSPFEVTSVYCILDLIESCIVLQFSQTMSRRGCDASALHGQAILPPS